MIRHEILVTGMTPSMKNIEPEFEHYIYDIQNKPEIICIQET